MFNKEIAEFTAGAVYLDDFGPIVSFTVLKPFPNFKSNCP